MSKKIPIIDLPKILELEGVKESKKNRKILPRKTQTTSELWYWRKLAKIVAELRKLTDGALAGIDLTTEEGARLLFAKLKQIEQLKLAELSEKLAQEFSWRTKKNHDEAFIKQLKNLFGVDVTAYLLETPEVSAVLRGVTLENIKLINSIPEQYLERIEKIVSHGVLSGMSNEQIAKELKRVGGITARRARFIARDQSAKFNGALEKAQQEDLGIVAYRWSSSRDNRVRPEHAENNGKIFRWDDPPPTGHPGQDFNCRCVAIPIIDIKPN